MLGILFVVITAAACAQPQVSIEASQVSSGFMYYRSDGSRVNDYSSLITGAYAVGFRNTLDGGFMLRASAGMRKGGASLVSSNNTYVWNLQYLDIKAGLGYMINYLRLKPYGLVSPYYAPLLKATQTIDVTTLDIKKSNSIKSYDYGLVFTAGCAFKASDYFTLFFEYNFLRGLNNNETGNTQRLYNTGSYLSLGISSGIARNTPKWLKK